MSDLNVSNVSMENMVPKADNSSMTDKTGQLKEYAGGSNDGIVEGGAMNVSKAAPAASGAPSAPRKKEDTEHTRRMKQNFAFFGPVTFLYALFYAVCMFHNGSGITFPFFMSGSLLYLCFCLSKLEISLKKGSAFYMISMMLLAVSTFCTDDWRIIAFNKTGIFLLMMSLLLNQFCSTSNWNLGKYLCAICQLIFASIGELGRPFSDGASYYKERGDNRSKKIWHVVLGVIIAVPILMIVLVLLTSADAVFRYMTNRFLHHINMGNILNVVFRIVFLFFAAYLLTAYLCKHAIKEEVKDRRNGEPVLAITITGLLSCLYVIFSVVQIVYLFMGKMQLPEGYTYAMYAREGFFQLLAVSILNLIIVLTVMSFFRESKILKIILTVMSLCTFIMIASSAIRMIMYIRYFYMTFLRIFVLWALAVLFLLFAGVIVSIYRESFPLFRYSAAVVTILYLALSFSHPDYMIASINVANTPREGMADWERSEDDFFQSSEPYHDYYYLSTLSADAAPVLLPYLTELGYDMNAFYEENIWDNENANPSSAGRLSSFGYHYMEHLKQSTEHFSLRTFNISRYMALKNMEECSLHVKVEKPSFPDLTIINETGYIISNMGYSCWVDGRYVGHTYNVWEDGEELEAGEAFTVNMEDIKVLKEEYSQVELAFEITIGTENRTSYSISENPKVDKYGVLADTYVLKGNINEGFVLEAAEY